MRHLFVIFAVGLGFWIQIQVQATRLSEAGLCNRIIGEQRALARDGRRLSASLHEKHAYIESVQNARALLDQELSTQRDSLKKLQDELNTIEAKLLASELTPVERQNLLQQKSEVETQVLKLNRDILHIEGRIDLANREISDTELQIQRTQRK